MCKKYVKCNYCQKSVNIGRLFFPGWHICVTQEEKKWIDQKSAFKAPQPSNNHHFAPSFLGGLGNYCNNIKQEQPFNNKDL